MKTALIVLLLVAPVSAQSVILDTSSEKGQSFARGMSWATLGVAAYAKTWEAWKAPERKKALVKEGAGLALTGGTTWLLKTWVNKPRPCAPADCGAEDPYKSFPSGHVANACFFIPVSSGKTAIVVGSILAIGTALGRILGNRHFPLDTMVGCADGLFNNWLLSKFQFLNQNQP